MTAIRNDQHFTHNSTFQPNSAHPKPLWDSITIFFPPSLPSSLASSSSTKSFPMKSHSCYLKIKLEVTTPLCTLVDLTLGIWLIPTPFLTPTPKPTSVENNCCWFVSTRDLFPPFQQLTMPTPSRGSSCLKQRVPFWFLERKGCPL